jgi:hypothetical protein
MGKQQAILDKHPTAGSTLQAGTGTTSAPDDSAAAALVPSPNLPANPKATSQWPSGNYSSAAFQSLMPTTAPAAKVAMGGYKIGSKYNGMTYLGDDPNNANNWQQ